MGQIKMMDVWKVFGEGPAQVAAVRGVSLTVEPGERIVVAGPSGSGKTTLLNLMSGLETPTRGEVLFEGQALSSLDEDALASLRLKRMGFVFQAFNLIPVLSAWENAEIVLMMLRRPPEERKRRLERYFQLFGLADLVSRRPFQMSGGQQQRVAVIRAIAHHNLDTDNAKRLLDILDHLNQEEGITLIFSSHDPLVIQHAQRVIYLRDGGIQKEERMGV